jgi:hypothetical protein
MFLCDIEEITTSSLNKIWNGLSIGKMDSIHVKSIDILYKISMIKS